MDKDQIFSIKMRASRTERGVSQHISGAEKLIHEDQLSEFSTALLQRALQHEKNKPDFIQLKMELQASGKIECLDAIKTTTISVDSAQEGLQKMRQLMERTFQTQNTDAILAMLPKTYSMRGAMLLNIDTLERLEPHFDRGIRATYMDDANTMVTGIISCKNHYNEAIVLATKVVNAPHILGEICISDDPNYITGYISSKKMGYVRITKLKEMGDKNGGRIFLFRGTNAEAKQTIDYLEKQCVLVKGVKPLHYTAKKGMQKNKYASLTQELECLKKKKLFREERVLESEQGAFVSYKDEKYLMLSSNSYLGLSCHPDMKNAMQLACQKFGTGSGGSRLTTGTTIWHKCLEKSLALFKHCEDAVVYNTGYMANVGCISALTTPEDFIFSDELNHASIVDGCRLSKARTIIYKHRDMQDLKAKIDHYQPERGLVISDAVFSMDGDIAPLPELLDLADDAGLFLMIDEAHATGVIGERGHGIVEYFHETRRPDILLGTLSKALGCEGGFICGSKILIDYLRNKSRSYIFSTSLPTPVMAAACCALDLLNKHPEMIQKLQNNVTFFCAELRRHGIETHSDSAIVPIIIGDEGKAMRIMKQLWREKIFLSAIRYPSVKKGSARLRATLMSTHTYDELKFAAEKIACCIKKDEC